MKRKVMGILFEDGTRIRCIKDDSATANPYRIIEEWYDRGWHSKTIGKYEDFKSVIWHIHEMAMSK